MAGGGDGRLLGLSLDEADVEMGGDGGAAAEAAAIEALLAPLVAFVHSAARPPLSEALLFSPSLREGGALAEGAPPIAAVRRLIGACRGRLVAADERCASLASLAKSLPSATAQQLRGTFASLSDELLAADSTPLALASRTGGLDSLRPPPRHLDQPQLARCTEALAVACTARATAAAATHLASLERALHLLLQHLSSWAQPPEPAALQPAAPLTHAAAAAVARAPRALRAAAKRGDPSAPGEPSLAVCLSSLLQLAPAAAFARHEAQLALVHALARKALDLLSGEPVL